MEIDNGEIIYIDPGDIFINFGIPETVCVVRSEPAHEIEELPWCYITFAPTAECGDSIPGSLCARGPWVLVYIVVRPNHDARPPCLLKW